MQPTFKTENLWLFLVLALSICWGVTSCSEQEPDLPNSYALVQAYPEYKDCEFKVVVTGEVLLSHPVEIHPVSDAFPDVYTAVDYDFYKIGPDTLTAKFKEPAADILARVKSPVPDKFIIGQWIKYEIRPIKSKCAPEIPQTVPKKRTQ